MSTFVSGDAKSQRAYVPTTALAKSVGFDEDMMHVLLTDGRRISVPLAWFPLLLKASRRNNEQSMKLAAAEPPCTGRN